MLNLFRILFPSWRFFDDPRKVSQLAYRCLKDGQAGPWHTLVGSPPMHWWQIFFNPAIGFRLAQMALIDRLVHESQHPRANPATFARRTTYMQIVQLIREETRGQTGIDAFQFKVSLAQGGDVLVSELHES